MIAELSMPDGHAALAAIRKTPAAINNINADTPKADSKITAAASRASGTVRSAVLPRAQIACAIKTTTAGFAPKSSPANCGVAPKRA